MCRNTYYATVVSNGGIFSFVYYIVFKKARCLLAMQKVIGTYCIHMLQNVSDILIEPQVGFYIHL